MLRSLDFIPGDGMGVEKMALSRTAIRFHLCLSKVLLAVMTQVD